jgi:hypothetical protein
MDIKKINDGDLDSSIDIANTVLANMRAEYLGKIIDIEHEITDIIAAHLTGLNEQLYTQLMATLFRHQNVTLETKLGIAENLLDRGSDLIDLETEFPLEKEDIKEVRALYGWRNTLAHHRSEDGVTLMLRTNRGRDKKEIFIDQETSPVWNQRADDMLKKLRRIVGQIMLIWWDQKYLWALDDEVVKILGETEHEYSEDGTTIFDYDGNVLARKPHNWDLNKAIDDLRRSV